MLTPSQSQALSALFNPDQVIADPVRLITYELDAGARAGTLDAVVLPHTTLEVQRLVRWASEHRVPLTPRGSGTGYTGGAITPQGGILVSLARMKAVVEIDELSQQATVQPGVISDDLNTHLATLNLIYPPDPSSKSVCTLGGTIAENAGGPHCLKYGVTSNYVLGLEVVLADGRRMRVGGRALDPPEYDFVGVITGSEGTLAIVTEATLRLRPPSQDVKALTASFASVATAGKAVSGLIAAGLMPATIELMDGNLIAIVEAYLQAGLPQGAGAMLIMDVDGYPDGLDPQLDDIVEVLNRFGPLEVKVARTVEERELLWLGRRSAGPAHVRVSPSEYALDVSVPRSRLAEALVAINEIGGQHGLPVTFMGHAGDGNLHPTLLCDLSDPEEVERVHLASGEILQVCAGLGGSISGEHGVGVEKRDYLAAMYSPPEIALMWEVKQLFDPDGMLNPGKIFPADLKPAARELTPAGPRPASLFEPASPAEAAEGLGALQAAREPTFIAGGGTKWRGQVIDGATLSTAGLCGITSLSVDDLYVTVMAGTQLDELQAELAGRGLHVPFANPWPGATAGGVVASNANGPCRALYGSVRDTLLAVQVALADGRLLRFGRPLIKDVAGYDIRKLFVGAHGTLGLLTEVTLKVVPLPLARRSLIGVTPDLQQGLAWASTVLRQATRCSGLILLPGSLLERGAGRYVLIFTAEGHAADVAAEIDFTRKQLRAAGAGEITETEVSATGQWEQVLAKGEFVVRIGVAPRAMPELLKQIEADITARPFVLDVPSGALTVIGPDPVLTSQEAVFSTLRTAVRQHGGYAVMLAGPRAWLHQPGAWGATPESLDLMRRLKAGWDPAWVLNAGEFITG